MFHVKHLCLLFVGKLFALARSSGYAIIMSVLFGGGDHPREFSQSINDALMPVCLLVRGGFRATFQRNLFWRS
jgi:hypothetical protein